MRPARRERGARRCRRGKDGSRLGSRFEYEACSPAGRVLENDTQRKKLFSTRWQEESGALHFKRSKLLPNRRSVSRGCNSRRLHSKAACDATCQTRAFCQPVALRADNVRPQRVFLRPSASRRVKRSGRLPVREFQISGEPRPRFRPSLCVLVTKNGAAFARQVLQASATTKTADETTDIGEKAEPGQPIDTCVLGLGRQ